MFSSPSGTPIIVINRLEKRKNKFLNTVLHLVVVSGIKLNSLFFSLLESQSTPSPSPTKVSPDKIVVIDQEKVVTTIEDAFVDHQRRERALAGMKAKIHTARPWQKKKTNNESANNHEESSEEELERAYR